ncbi:MAG: hypothetical protein WCO50_00165 [Synechococcus sp. ELA619]
MFSLKQQYGISLSTGENKKLNQFQILFDGVLVGYLPYGDKAQIQAIFQFPHDKLDAAVLVKLGKEAAEGQGLESVTVEGPEQYSRQFVKQVEKALAEEDADDDE